jgi:competence protein ComGC
MKNKSLTMLELTIVILIIGILLTFGLPAYRNIVEDYKTKVCEANQYTLITALDIYALEHERMPGDLSEIPDEYLQKAYACMFQQKGSWKTKLAYYIIGWEQRGLAFAGLLQDLARGNIRLITCPADKTPPPDGRSYGMNSVLKNMTFQRYHNLGPGTLLIGDCEKAEFTSTGDLEMRHKRYTIGTVHRDYANAIRKDKKIEKRFEGEAAPLLEREEEPVQPAEKKVEPEQLPETKEESKPQTEKTAEPAQPLETKVETAQPSPQPETKAETAQPSQQPETKAAPQQPTASVQQSVTSAAPAPAPPPPPAPERRRRSRSFWDMIRDFFGF